MHSKATHKGTTGTKRPEIALKLAHLPLDLQIQARQLFFTYYIADFSRTWTFLYPYFNPKDAPEHVSLSIDAVSLAFLSHHIGSPSAHILGRHKYVSALKKTNKVLQDPRSAQRTTTLEASLILDLFEKINTPAREVDETQRAHVDGAFALIKLRGLNHFKDGGEMSVLTRLTLNALVCSVSESAPVPEELLRIREHTSQYFNVKDPKWRFTGVMLEMTTFVAEANKGILSLEQKIRKCAELDKKLEQVAIEAPPIWSYERKYVSSEARSGRIFDDFYDVYNARMTTQMWNVLRLTRVIICDEIVESCSALNDEEKPEAYERAKAAVAITVEEICASVPQMTDCEGAARDKLPPGSVSSASSSHSHTLSHFLDNYILIFSLYVAAWSWSCPTRAHTWILEQLEYIADHFGVKEAAAVVEILRSQSRSTRVRPWDVYRLLGSYAFAA